MREAVGGISIFQIVITLILVFVGIMCLTINHSKAFGVKDEIINIIEKDTSFNKSNGELSMDTIDEIRNHLDNSGHRITGVCPEDYIGYSRKIGEHGKYNAGGSIICIKPIMVDSEDKELIQKCKAAENNCRIVEEDFPTMVYYEMILFYQLDIPLLNNFMNFKLYGSTKVLSG